MSKLPLYLLCAVLVAAAAVVTAESIQSLPADAGPGARGVTVQLEDGSIKTVGVDAKPDESLDQVKGKVPGVPLGWAKDGAPPQTPAPEQPKPAPQPQKPASTPDPQAGPATEPGKPAQPATPATPAASQPPAAQATPSAPAPAPAPAPGPQPQPTPAPGVGLGQSAPQPTGESEQQKPTGDRRRAKRPSRGDRSGGARAPKTKAKKNTRLRNGDGSPAVSNPGFVDALPGPSFRSGVPNFVIRKFRVPIFLLPIYQAAGIEYGVRWEVLAAINEIETDYGRNLNVSSAGALGWMQFIPSSWRMYGTDANKDGRKDPYNPVDAIFAAGRYLKAAGYADDVRRAIFAYNHADWYVDSVLLRARLIAGVPADLVGSLTGLTEGRFPVAARARYADDLQEHQATKRVKAGQNAAHIVNTDDTRHQIEIYTRKGAPAVAVNDGQIKTIHHTPTGHTITLQDAYGNRYTYTGLQTTATHYPVPRQDVAATGGVTRAVAAHQGADPRPHGAASQGRQPEAERERHAAEPTPERSVAVKERLFAHPDMPGARDQGGLEQLMESEADRGGLATYESRFARPVKLDPKRFTLRPMRKGARVIAGTVLGTVGQPEPDKAPHLEFGIRPAGKGAPRIDPKPILDGWKLLEATSIYRASGKNVLRGEDSSFSIGQILLMPKPLLEKRVLSDERIDIYPCGRADIKSGQIDRRVLATLAYLAESGLRPTVTSLKCGHGFYTSSGNVSHHSSGNAVDIAKINGIPILGHQEPGGVTEQTVRRIMALQGTLSPRQIISLLDIGGATLAMADHNDHIHVGFRPLFGSNAKLGKQALAVLKPGQWSDLIEQLRKIDNPVVPTKPSKYSLPARRPASHAHRGD